MHFDKITSDNLDIGDIIVLLSCDANTNITLMEIGTEYVVVDMLGESARLATTCGNTLLGWWGLKELNGEEKMGAYHRRFVNYSKLTEEQKFLTKLNGCFDGNR